MSCDSPPTRADSTRWFLNTDTPSTYTFELYGTRSGQFSGSVLSTGHVISLKFVSFLLVRMTNLPSRWSALYSWSGSRFRIVRHSPSGLSAGRNRCSVFVKLPDVWNRYLPSRDFDR